MYRHIVDLVFLLLTIGLFVGSYYSYKKLTYDATNASDCAKACTGTCCSIWDGKICRKAKSLNGGQCISTSSTTPYYLMMGGFMSLLLLIFFLIFGQRIFSN